MFPALWLAAVAAAAFAQSGLTVDVSPNGYNPQNYFYTSEQRKPPQDGADQGFNSDLKKRIKDGHDDATYLYTQYTSKAKAEYKNFMKNVSEIYDLAAVRAEDESDSCLLSLNLQLQRARHRSMKAALFNGDIHHKYLKGHVIVFRMHLNKSAEYLQKCDRFLSSCSGVRCETNPQVVRWRRQATHEIQRFVEDFRFSQRYYRDIVTHARKNLIHLRKEAHELTRRLGQEYQECRRRLV